MKKEVIEIVTETGIVSFTIPQIACLNDLVVRELAYSRYRLKEYHGINDNSLAWLSSTVDFYSDLLNNLHLLFPKYYETNNRDNG